MWLLNCETLQLKSFEGENRPRYAILSHRWEAKEVLFQDVMDGRHTELQGWQKIKACCEQAKRDGLDYVWADTCCIDKRSSAELSEAINSMYKWYERARVCYAYLADVAVDQASSNGAEITNSVWFTRGWTLQELLAPKRLEFFDCHWKRLGTKEDYVDAIKDKTGIPVRALIDFELQAYCIAQKMSWAAGRKTTRIEDRTYSLLGLLDVNMPLLYGEADRAFERLQNELTRTSTDDSIYAWSIPQLPRLKLRVLASSPECYSWEPSLQLERNMTQSSTSKEGVTGRFHLAPYCFDVVVASVGYGRSIYGRNTYYSINIFLVKVGQDHYQRALLDGRGCDVIELGEFQYTGPKWTLPDRTITIQSAPVLTRSSDVLHIYNQICPHPYTEPVLGLLQSASSEFEKQSFVRRYVGKILARRREMKAHNCPLIIRHDARAANSSACLILRKDWMRYSYNMAIAFTRNHVSAPTALVLPLERTDLGHKSTELSHPALPEWCRNRYLTKNNQKTHSGQYSAEDSKALKSAFHEIDKENTGGARLQQLGDNIKVAFVPVTDGHRVLLAFEEWTEEINLPREWLYPPPEGKRP